MYRQSEKNLLNINTSSTCLCNMVNFGPITAENCWRWPVTVGVVEVGVVDTRYGVSQPGADAER